MYCEQNVIEFQTPILRLDSFIGTLVPLIVGGREFDPRPRHIEDNIKVVPAASLLNDYESASFINLITEK